MLLFGAASQHKTGALPALGKAAADSCASTLVGCLVGSALCRTFSAPRQEILPFSCFATAGTDDLCTLKEAPHLLEQLFENWVAGQREAQPITAGELHCEDND